MKTIEEAAKEYAITRSYENKIQFILDNEAFKKGVEFAQRWIPVEEELPEEGTNFLHHNRFVLIKLLDGKIKTALLMHGVWYFDELFHQNAIITHWRPIELK